MHPYPIPTLSPRGAPNPSSSAFGRRNKRESERKRGLLQPLSSICHQSSGSSPDRLAGTVLLDRPPRERKAGGIGRGGENWQGPWALQSCTFLNRPPSTQQNIYCHVSGILSGPRALCCFDPEREEEEAKKKKKKKHTQKKTDWRQGKPAAPGATRPLSTAAQTKFKICR